MTEENTQTTASTAVQTTETTELNNKIGLNTEENTQTTASTAVQTTENKSDNATTQINENEYIGTPEVGYNTDNVQLPEGMTLDEDLMKTFNEFAPKVNMSQKAYDEVLNYGVQIAQKTQQNMIDAFKQQQALQVEQYKRDLHNDTEIGGEKLNEAMAVAGIAYKEFADENVRKIMAETGLEFNPAIVKMFRKIGSLMQDDRAIFTNKGVNKQESITDRMFPSMKK